jgi:hypothetical protein
MRLRFIAEIVVNHSIDSTVKRRKGATAGRPLAAKAWQSMLPLMHRRGRCRPGATGFTHAGDPTMKWRRICLFGLAIAAAAPAHAGEAEVVGVTAQRDGQPGGST